MKSIKLVLFLAICFSVASIAKPIQITRSDFGDAKQPQLALNDKGYIFLVFGNLKGIWFTSSTDGGKSFSNPKKIAEIDGLALGMRRGPRIVASENIVTVTAISHKEGILSSWHSSDGGASWSGPVAVNEIPTSAREGMHGLAGDGNGSVYVVWLDLRNKKTELWGAKSIDGGKSWGENVQIYKSPDQTICECCHPSVIFTPKGQLIAMWRNWLDGSRDIYRSLSTDGGKTFGAAAKLGTGTWPLNGCPMDGGSLAASDGETAYVWRRAQKLFVTTKAEPEILISESGSHPVVVPRKDGFHFIWQSGGNLHRKSDSQQGDDVLARNGAYASVAWSRNSKAAFVAWEGISDGVTSVFIDRLE